MAATRKAFFYNSFGSIDVIEYGDLPVPEVREKDVVIRTRGVGMNPVDWKLREGMITVWPQKFPTITGWDVAGTVESVGAGVTNFKVGDEVFAYTRPMFENDPEDNIGERDGTAAEVVVVPEEKVALKPTTLSFPEAAGIPLASLTAWQSLFDKGAMKEGESVVVLNASGGVGSFAVQFAKIKGAGTVVGTCSSKNAEYVASLGADQVIDYKSESVPDALAAAFPDGVDVIIDCIGGDSSKAALPCVKSKANGGRFVSIVDFAIGAAAEKLDKQGYAHLVEPSSSQLAEIAGLVDSGKLKCPHLTVLPFAELKEAQTQVETHRTRGKIVLTL